MNKKLKAENEPCEELPEPSKDTHVDIYDPIADGWSKETINKEFDSLPDDCFEDMDDIVDSGQKVEKLNVFSNSERIESILYELSIIEDEMKEILDSDTLLDESHIARLNALKLNRIEFRQKKDSMNNDIEDIEDAQYGVIEASVEEDIDLSQDKTDVKQKDIPVLSEPIKEVLLMDIESQEVVFHDHVDDTIQSVYESIPDTINDTPFAFDHSPSNYEATPSSQFNTPLKKSFFTPIQPFQGEEVEQYNPWTAKTSKWARSDFPWSEDLSILNYNIFGHHRFRINQHEIVNAVLSKKDVLVTMPTGGGKSLCYQLPAIYSDSITVVVQPLISLIEDQLTILRGLGITVEFLGQSVENLPTIHEDLESVNPKTKILFMTPEKLMLNEKTMGVLVSLYQRKRIHLFVVDECHCVSQWGHEFRPQYKELRILKEKFPLVPILALTATATPSVKEDILNVLHMKSPNLVCFTSSFNRPNIYYDIRKKTFKKVIDDIDVCLKEYNPDDSGIIYCLSKPDCEEVSNNLRSRGYKCDYYHADLSLEDRQDIQHRWMSGDLQFLCATIAFGMGVNKPDVRFVIHHSIPKSIEGYYQESGRVGRDGKSSTCILFFGMKDKMRLETMIHGSYRNSDNMSQRALKSNLDKLREMVSFCENTVDCRRKQLTEYFGEKMEIPEDHKCGMCDNCLDASQIYRKDMKQIAEHVLELATDIMKRRDRKTKTSLLNILRGKDNNSFSNQLKGYGSCKMEEISILDRVLNQMVIDKLLEEDYDTNAYGVVTYLKPGKQQAIDHFLEHTPTYVFGFRKKRSPLKPKNPTHRNKNANFLTCFSEEKKVISPRKKSTVMTKLLELREQIHREECSLNPSKSSSIEMLFPTALLQDIADKLPQTMKEFEQIEGVGKKKADLYAARFVLLILNVLQDTSSHLKEYSGVRKKLFNSENAENVSSNV